MRSDWRRWTFAALLTLLAFVALSIVLAARNGPTGRIVLAAGGGDGVYLNLARTYQAQLKRHGVTLELRNDLQGADLIRELQDPRSGIDGGIIKGGFMGSLQGRFASARARDRHDEQTLATRSVGRLALEPIWVFTRGDLPITTLRDLEGKKILTGTLASGARRVAVQLLKANGVNAENSTLIDEDLDADASALLKGRADAGILILAPETERVQKLLRVENIRLMDFSPEAKAYTSRFPALSSVVMYRASVEFEPVIPSADITLLATSPALIIRKDLPPALVSLLTSAILQNPKSPFDSAGDPVLFHKAGQFPNSDDPEYDVADAARLVYKTGELPLLLRMIAPINARFGMPFALTSFASAYGIQTVLLLIPTLTILLPLLRLVPMLYSWSIRQRLIYWYAALKALERKMDNSDASLDLTPLLGEIERIDAAARRIRVPLEYSDQLYDLRGHIDLVRRRLHQWPEPLKYMGQPMEPPPDMPPAAT